MPESMDPTPDQKSSVPAAAPYRIDVKLHDVLMEAYPANGHPASPTPKMAEGAGVGLPVPVYPQRTYSDDDEPSLVQYQRMNARRAWDAWARPYFASRSLTNRK